MLRALVAVAAVGRAAANGRHDASGHVIAGLAQEELAVTERKLEQKRAAQIIRKQERKEKMCPACKSLFHLIPPN